MAAGEPVAVVLRQHGKPLTTDDQQMTLPGVSACMLLWCAEFNLPDDRGTHDPASEEELLLLN
jgi:hypothetical protein